MHLQLKNNDKLHIIGDKKGRKRGQEGGGEKQKEKEPIPFCTQYFIRISNQICIYEYRPKNKNNSWIGKDDIWGKTCEHKSCTKKILHSCKIFWVKGQNVN